VTGLGAPSTAAPDGAVATAPSPVPPYQLAPNFNIAGALVQPSYVGDAVGLVAGIVQVNVPVPQTSLGGQTFLNASQFTATIYIAP